MPLERYDFCVLTLAGGEKRVDQFISDDAKICSRNQLKQRLDTLRVNGKSVRLSRRIMPKDHIELVLQGPPALEISPEEMPLDILYEDDQVIVLDKPQGLVVHPAPGNYSGTLVHGLLFYGGKETETQDLRPGIVHRLDKDTSGVLITAKNEKAHQFLAAQFQQKSTQKEYLALCRGRMKPEKGEIENNLGRSPRNRQRFAVVTSGGKYAFTSFQVLRRWKRVTLVRTSAPYRADTSAAGSYASYRVSDSGGSSLRTRRTGRLHTDAPRLQPDHSSSGRERTTDLPGQTAPAFRRTHPQPQPAGTGIRVISEQKRD